MHGRIANWRSSITQIVTRHECSSYFRRKSLELDSSAPWHCDFRDPLACRRPLARRERFFAYFSHPLDIFVDDHWFWMERSFGPEYRPKPLLRMFASRAKRP